MLHGLHTFDMRTRTRSLLLAVLLALALHLAASTWLNNSYAASGFAVPYYEAQLSFDAAKLKLWYAQLLRGGTLGTYLQTQHIDFLFIASVALLHPLALLLVGRLFKPASSARRWFTVAAALSIGAPAADAVENGVSYVMLADPLGFNPNWALVYSSFAALKFGMFGFAYAAALVGVLVGVGMRASAWIGHAMRGTRTL